MSNSSKRDCSSEAHSTERPGLCRSAALVGPTTELSETERPLAVEPFAVFAASWPLLPLLPFPAAVFALAAIQNGKGQKTNQKFSFLYNKHRYKISVGRKRWIKIVFNIKFPRVLDRVNAKALADDSGNLSDIAIEKKNQEIRET